MPYLSTPCVRNCITKRLIYTQLYDAGHDRRVCQLGMVAGAPSLQLLTTPRDILASAAVRQQWRNDGVAAASSDRGPHWW